jgi:hypothetical protein
MRCTLQPSRDRGRVVGGAVLAEEVLQHVRRHDGVLLKAIREILADHEAREVLEDLSIEHTRGEHRRRSALDALLVGSGCIRGHRNHS